MPSSNVQARTFFTQPSGVFLAMFIVALVARLVFIVVYPASRLGGGDSIAYWSFAQGIATGHGFRSTFEPWLADRPPLYPYFLSLVVRTVGQNATVVYLLQAIIGALAAGLFSVIVIRLANVRCGWIGGLLFVFLPHFLLFTKQILTEDIYIFLYVGLMAVLLVPTQGGRWWWLQWIGAGLFIGLLALERREGLLPAILVTLTVAIGAVNERWPRRIQCLAIAFIVAGLTVLPWMLRNQRALGVFTLSSSSGANFMVGNNPIANGSYSPPPDSWQAQFNGIGELERDSLAWKLSLDWIRQNPSDFIKLLPRKIEALLAPAGNIIPDVFDVLLIPFYFVGLFVLIQTRKTQGLALILALIPIFSSLLTTLIFVGGWRYRLIMYPGLLLLATYGLAAVLTFGRKRLTVS